MSLVICKLFLKIEIDKLIKNNKEDIKGAEANKKTPILKEIREYFLFFIKSIIFNILYFQSIEENMGLKSKVIVDSLGQ